MPSYFSKLVWLSFLRAAQTIFGRMLNIWQPYGHLRIFVMILHKRRKKKSETHGDILSIPLAFNPKSVFCVNSPLGVVDYCKLWYIFWVNSLSSLMLECECTFPFKYSYHLKCCLISRLSPEFLGPQLPWASSAEPFLLVTVPLVMWIYVALFSPFSNLTTVASLWEKEIPYIPQSGFTIIILSVCMFRRARSILWDGSISCIYTY